MEQITLEHFKNAIPTRVSLIYIDYRDSLDDNVNTLSEVVITGTLNPIWEMTNDYFVDQEFDSIDQITKEAIQRIANDLEIEEDIVEQFAEEHEDEIRGIIWDRDDSDATKDLLRNTSKQVMFYDTGYEVCPDSWSWDGKRIKQEVKDIKKVLGIKLKITTWDNNISIMVRQASYGGQLVIYFRGNVEDVVFDYNAGDFKSISFDNLVVAIINTCNGSGDSCGLNGHNITLEFHRENLHLERSIKYNYTYEVCGMSSDWADSCEVTFGNESKAKTIKINNAIAQEVQRNIEYTRVYKSGSCTVGDMDTNRHRKTSYINNYPCGTKCADCGTFWID